MLKGGVALRSSFPHASERWETLSAHWEGLTSFWIQRLEKNANERNKDPYTQKLERQVTDLSAAGANLFHAVVALQRLRASSERKFQRWFFETREEQEKMREVQVKIESELLVERATKESAIDAATALQAEAELMLQIERRTKSDAVKAAIEIHREENFVLKKISLDEKRLREVFETNFEQARADYAFQETQLQDEKNKRDLIEATYNDVKEEVSKKEEENEMLGAKLNEESKQRMVLEAKIKEEKKKRLDAIRLLTMED